MLIVCIHQTKTQSEPLEIIDIIGEFYHNSNECRRQYRSTVVDARSNERGWKQRWRRRRRRRAATTKSHQPMQKTLSSIVYCHWMHTHRPHFSSVHIVPALDFFCQSSTTLCISFLWIFPICWCYCCCWFFLLLSVRIWMKET